LRPRTRAQSLTYADASLTGSRARFVRRLGHPIEPLELAVKASAMSADVKNTGCAASRST